MTIPYGLEHDVSLVLRNFGIACCRTRGKHLVLQRSCSKGSLSGRSVATCEFASATLDL